MRISSNSHSTERLRHSRKCHKRSSLSTQRILSSQLDRSARGLTMNVRPLFLLAATIVCQPGTATAQFAIKPAATAAPAAQSVAAEETNTSITIPAGTTVLMTLRSPLNTVSAHGDAGLYLETVGAVIQQDRIVIPAKTLVQGVLARASRPGPRERTRAAAIPLHNFDSSQQLPNSDRRQPAKPARFEALRTYEARRRNSVCRPDRQGCSCHGEFRRHGSGDRFGHPRSVRSRDGSTDWLGLWPGQSFIQPG